MESVFWASMLWLTYIYVGYPLAIWAVGRMRSRPVRAAPVRPSVTVVIAAYNEARHIAATVRNKLEQSYPPELLDVIVVSDGSTDGTDELVHAINSPRVTLLRQDPRQGKTAGLNLALARASGDIISFADANSIWAADALQALVRPFADPEVGYVTGRMVYVDASGSLVGDGCDAYMRYENRLRELETRCGSVVGVDGGIDAVRRALYVPMKADHLPDFVLPLAVVAKGYRAVYVPEALLQEHSLGDARSEYRMRVRVALRALRALLDMSELLNPLRHGVFAWQLWSHKVLRYLAIVPMVTALLSCVLLAPESRFFAAMLLVQVVFYVVAIVGLLRPGGLGRLRLFAWPAYLVVLNIASGHAFLRLLRGDRVVLWQPRVG